jgi:SAM-dependent methyltransferase
MPPMHLNVNPITMPTPSAITTHPILSTRFASSAAIALCVFMFGCATQTRVPLPAPTEKIPPRTPVAEAPRTPTQLRLINEANTLLPLAKTELGQRFLRATDGLAPGAVRTVLRDDNTREFFSPAEAERLPAERRAKLSTLQEDEARYYYTRYGTPLAYLRALEIASQNGVADVAGKRVMDFGYGAIGHLRLLASLGAHVTGVDPDSYLAALYQEPADQGSFPNAKNVYRGVTGSVTLAHGYWPKDGPVSAQVAKNAPYQLILSKNTLKRGYLKPMRPPASKSQLIELGVSDEAFLKSIVEALAPGGVFIIYNISPKLSPPNERFRPWSDGRSPFSREQYQKAGLTVVAIDVEDSPFVREMGGLLGWDMNDKGEKVDDLSTNLFGLYTILKKP